MFAMHYGVLSISFFRSSPTFAAPLRPFAAGCVCGPGGCEALSWTRRIASPPGCRARISARLTSGAVLAKITGNSPDSVAARKAVADATESGSEGRRRLCLLVRDATALRDTGANGPLKKVRTIWPPSVTPNLDAIVAIIDSAKTDANASGSELDSIITDLTTKITQTVVPGGELVYLDQLLALVDKVPPLIDKIQSTIVQGLERAVLTVLPSFSSPVSLYLKKMVSIAFQGMGPVFVLSDASHARRRPE